MRSENPDTKEGDPFSIYYAFEKGARSSSGDDEKDMVPSSLPYSVEPDGREVVGDYAMDARWNLYQSCERMREKNQARNKRTAGERDAEEDGQREQITMVIQSLVDARSELDVIRDVISVLEDQQQFLSIMHIPHSAVQHAAKREGLIRQGMKKAQMHSIANRLRSGAHVLRQTFCVDTQFFKDVEYLKKRWLVRECERVGHVFGEDCVMIDISMGVEDAFEWLRDAKKSLGKYTFLLSRSDDTGEVFGLFPESPAGEEKVVVGREQIDAILKTLRDMRAWTFICRVLDAESEDLSNIQSLRGIIHPGVQDAVMALAHKMLPQQHDTPEVGMCPDPHMKYVSDFYETEICPSLFQKKAMLTLKNAMSWHLVPEIIRQTTRTRNKTFLEQLCFWMSSASMWYDAARLTVSSKEDFMSSPLLEYIRLSAERVTCLPATIHIQTGEDSLVESVVIGEDYSMSLARDQSHLGRLQILQLIEKHSTNDSFNISIHY